MFKTCVNTMETHLVCYTVTHRPVFHDMGLLFCNKLIIPDCIINLIYIIYYIAG